MRKEMKYCIVLCRPCYGLSGLFGRTILKGA